VIDSNTLFTEGRNEVAIRHNGRVYRLRCTRLGKLILTA
jgi:hemin uptake protein HemP